MNRRDGLRIGVASVFSAASAYIVMLLAARTLSKEDNAQFLVWWGLLYAIYGTLMGLQAETTRTVAAAEHSNAPCLGKPRVAVVGLVLGLAAAVVAGSTSIWWAPALLDSRTGYLVLGLTIGIALFAGNVTAVGVLSGRRLWGAASLLVGGDALLRLLLAAFAAGINPSVAAFAIATALGSMAWVLLIPVLPALRATRGARADVGLRRLLTNTGHSCVAAASSAVLLAGYPVLLRLSSTEEIYASAAPLILAVSLTRGPLLIPLNAYQGAAIAYFVKHRGRGLIALWPIVRLVLVAGCVGIIFAAFLGPEVMTLIRVDYVVSGGTLAGLAGGAMLVAVLTLTGSTCLAENLHGAFAAGWIVATVVAFCTLLLPLDLDQRVVSSLLLGPILGTIVHMTAIRRSIARQARRERAAFER